MKKWIKRAEKALFEVSSNEEQFLWRPKYHFHSMANWMNDPNGLIYWNNYFHIFYQLNPYKARWGKIHWGHAKSADLVHWDHLPIALAPSKERGERYCFSGTCIPFHGEPVIFYTSIKSLLNIIRGAEQWMAIPQKKDPLIIQWEKPSVNPILTDQIHPQLKIRHLRDPFLWEQEGIYFMLLGGQLIHPKRGAIFLYSSSDLYSWTFERILIEGGKSFRKPWECPNYIKFDKKSLLIISPMDKTRYIVGLFENRSFIPDTSAWNILDHGKCFYAPQVFNNLPDRNIIIGWIKGGGKGKWNGCFSIPRLLELQSNYLIIHPIPELKKLRKEHVIQQKSFESGESSHNLILPSIPGKELELIISFKYKMKKSDLESKVPTIGLKIKNAQSPRTYSKKDALIIFRPHKRHLRVNKEEGILLPKTCTTNQIWHFYFDHSVLEMFINYRETITAKIYPPLKRDKLKLIFYWKNVNIDKLEMNGWILDSNLKEQENNKNS